MGSRVLTARAEAGSLVGKAWEMLSERKSINQRSPGRCPNRPCASPRASELPRGAIPRPTPATHSADPRSGVQADRDAGGRGETQGEGSNAEIRTAPRCSGSHHAAAKGGLSV